MRISRLVLVVLVSLLIFGARDAMALAEFQPYTPSGWSGPLVVSNVSGTNTNSAGMLASDTLYVDWAVANFGDVAGNLTVSLLVDGSVIQTWVAGSLNPFFYSSVEDFVIAGLEPGDHAIQLVADPANVTAENNEVNNTFTNNFSLGGGAPEIRIEPVDVTYGTPPPPALAASPTVFGTTDYATTGLVGKDETKQLLAKAHAEGSVRVIARLDIDFKPEGVMNPSEASLQRSSIAASQNSVVASLGLPEQAVKRFRTVPFVAMEVSAAQLERLASLPGVRDIVEDEAHPVAMASSNPRIGSPVAWAAGYTGAGQTVAVLDTGVNSSHPFFGGGKIVSEACYSTTSAPDGISSVCPGGVSSSTAAGSGTNCNTSVPGCDHGTHVAGTVAGNDGVGPNFGVARDADLIAIQVFSQFTGTTCTNAGETSPCVRSFTSDQILGLERVLALSGSMDIAAVNMSLGGGQFFSQVTCDASNSAIKAAIDNLRSAGVATVIASGNNGFLDSMGTPGCVSTAISVGATDDLDNVASFSNIVSFVSLVAPGVSITSSVPGGGVGVKQGTSMATPHVAGAFAVIRQAMPDATVTDVLNLLRNTARQRNDLRAGGSVTGLRRIDVGEAILSSIGQGFTIFNDGNATLNVSGITPATSAPWITSTPTTPFTVLSSASRFVTVDVDMGTAPGGSSTTRLNVTSDDADESPYPDAVDIIVHNGAGATVTIAATDNTAVENPLSTGTFTVTRTGSTASALTVNYTVGGTATTVADYTALAGTVTINSGSATATITVTPVNDALVEGNETVIVTLAAGTGYSVGAPAAGTVTISSEDLAPPANVVATATSPTSVDITWNAVAGAGSYRVYRSANRIAYSLVGSPVTNSFTDATGLAANTAYVYKVRSFGVTESADSSLDVATTSLITTDPVITPGATSVKAAHWTQVLAAVNSFRALASLAPLSLTPSPTAGGAILRQTVLDLRAGLDAARTVILVPAAVYADTPLPEGAVIEAQHLIDLRTFSR